MSTSAAIIPAYQAQATVGDVVRQLVGEWRALRSDEPKVVVVDDGSTDRTAAVARAAGAEVIVHAKNLGKGAALASGLAHAHRQGVTVVVALDADGQHPPREALAVLSHPASMRALVLGVRDLVAAGAPKANQFSNAFSNIWLSGFCGQRLQDTQCGLRRYPVEPTLALGLKARGYGFEAEIILRAAHAGWSIIQTPVEVHYPPAEARTTHFHSIRDPFRIVLRILHTVATRRRA